VGIRARSDQSVTWVMFLSVVRGGPQNRQVVHPCSSQRGSQLTVTPWCSSPPSVPRRRTGARHRQVYGGYTTGTSPVHDRYTAGSADTVSGAATGTRLPLRGGPDGMARPVRQAASVADTNKGQPAARREQDCEELAGRDVRYTPVRRGVRCPGNGTKRARIGKASGSTDRSFGPDAVRLPASPR